MDIIRIPTHYAMQITYMSVSDKAYVLDSIMRLSIWEVLDIEKSMRWGIVLSIWTEAVQLENKASAKKWHSLKIDLAPMVQPMVQSNFKNDATKSSQTKSIQVNPSQDNSNQISIETEQAPTYWNEELNMMQWYLRKAVWVTQFKDSKERWYVQHCYNLLKKIGREEFEIRLKEILSDQFKSKNCNKLQYLYWELKSYIHTPVISNTPKVW